MLKAYKYCLLPNDEQKEQLSKFFGCCRFVYNLGLETKVAAWQSAKKNIGLFELINQMVDLKNNECEWLKECPAQALQLSLKHLDAAYFNFFRGGGFPRFKKRDSIQSIQFPQRVHYNEKQIFIPKLKWVDFVQHRAIGVGKTKTVTVSKTTTGKYFVSILIEDDNQPPAKKKITTKSTVGVDVGLKSFAVLSDGQIFANPKYFYKQLKNLRVKLRTLGRRYKKNIPISGQSIGWHKQRLVVAKLHEKIANQRKDFLHKISTAIIKQYDTVCIEDLNIKGMQQSNLAKSVSDASWYEFTKLLAYKADWYGKTLITIGRFDPSSKTCSSCGNIFKELMLSDRIWTCEKCGTTHDRDHNAAKNIKNFGSKARPTTAKTS